MADYRVRSLETQVERLQSEKMELIRSTSTEIDRLRQIIRNLTDDPLLCSLRSEMVTLRKEHEALKAHQQGTERMMKEMRAKLQDHLEDENGKAQIGVSEEEIVASTNKTYQTSGFIPESSREEQKEREVDIPIYGFIPESSLIMHQQSMDQQASHRRGQFAMGTMHFIKDLRMVKKLALVAHNNMKDEMRNFVGKFKDVLVNYTLVGTETTLKTIKKEMKEYHEAGELKLGAPYSSGPFGGDAQLAAAIVSGDIGCLIFFVDPLSTQPHTADVDSLIRLARVHEILLATNSMTAYSIIEALRVGLRDYEELPAPMKVGDETMSAAVPAYKKRKSVDKAAKGAM